jgi:hypothetical protein
VNDRLDNSSNGGDGEKANFDPVMGSESKKLFVSQRCVDDALAGAVAER